MKYSTHRLIQSLERRNTDAAKLVADRLRVYADLEAKLRKMREAQREYFRTKESYTLKLSKQLEGEVDAMLKELDIK